MSADERAAKGKTLRDAAPRTSHAGWSRDPVELLSASNQGRVPALIPIGFGRMSASPFAFYPSSAALMAADLAHTPTSGIRVQPCGDAHLMSFGGFATPERNVIFDINDLDETLPAPFEWDLKGLAASVMITANYLQLPNSDAAMMAGYMGSGQSFDDAIGEFAVEYAAQNRTDYRAFIKAIREGRIPAALEG